MLRRKKIIIILITLLVIAFAFVAFNNFRNVSIFLNKIDESIPANIKKKLLNTVLIFKKVEILKKQIAQKDSEFQDFLENPDISITYNFRKEENIEKKNFDKIKENQNKDLLKNLAKTKIANQKILLTKFKLPHLKDIGYRAYLNYQNNKLFLITGSGVLMFTSKKNIESENFTFKKINTNFNDIVGEKYVLGRKPIVRHFFIKENKIYISIMAKIKDDCYYNKILVGDLNLENIILKEFFSLNECQPVFSFAVGGKIADFKDGKILFSIGDHGSVERVVNPITGQVSKESLVGKIISLEEKSGKYRILSMGHRNPQGLFYDKKDDIIYSTEHGPKGGDEINLIVPPPREMKIKNYGWPISSYGEHYDYNLNVRHKKGDIIKRAPLHNSHSQYGFTEPLMYFVPSIAPTQIIKTEEFIKVENKNIIYVASLGGSNPGRHRSVHQFILNNNLKVEEHNIIPIGSRVRDIIYIKEFNKMFLFLENIQSIGVLELDK